MFLLKDTATTEIYTLTLHDALPISGQPLGPPPSEGGRMTVSAELDERTLREIYLPHFEAAVKEANVASVMCAYNRLRGYRKSTRLNSSHANISHAVFCLKK